MVRTTPETPTAELCSPFLGVELIPGLDGSVLAVDGHLAEGQPQGREGFAAMRGFGLSAQTVPEPGRFGILVEDGSGLVVVVEIAGLRLPTKAGAPNLKSIGSAKAPQHQTHFSSLRSSLSRRREGPAGRPTKSHRV